MAKRVGWLVVCVWAGCLGLFQNLWASCGELTSPQLVFICALKEHPRVQQAQARLKQGETLVEVASQRPNPELDGNYAMGMSAGEIARSGQIAISHIFELGGKRSARQQRAVFEREILALDVLQAQEQVALEMAVLLVRLRHIQTEQHVIDEALATFVQVQRQLQSRPRLTHDQEVAARVFQLAESAYRIQLTALESESQSWIRQLELATGQTGIHLARVLPPFREVWPELESELSEMRFEGSEMRRGRTERNLAQSEFSVAQSAAWPNLKVGPLFQTQTQSLTSFYAYGVNLSLPLPLYQRNEAGKTFALKGVDAAETAFKTVGAQLRAERQREWIQYEAARKAIGSSGALREIERSHQHLDQLFRSGLIQASLIVEAHRQIVDLTQSVNAQELKAIRALWRIYTIEGRIFSETLS